MNGAAPAAPTLAHGPRPSPNRVRLDDLPEMLTTKQVLRLLGISTPRTLRIMCGQEPPLFPPPRKFNQRFQRWLREEVVDWFRRNRRDRIAADAADTPTPAAS